MRKSFLRMGLLLLAFSGPALASNVSLVSGFYKKNEPDNAAESSQFSLGARVGLGASQLSQWYAEARFASTSYSGDGAPDSSTNLSLGGGQYYFMRSFGPGIRSYLSWLLAFANEESSPNPATKNSSSGLFYAGNAGFRFDLSPRFFFDINALLFESALMATDSSETTAGGTSNKVETKRMELYLDTFGGVEDISFGLGMEF